MLRRAGISESEPSMSRIEGCHRLFFVEPGESYKLLLEFLKRYNIGQTNAGLTLSSIARPC